MKHAKCAISGKTYSHKDLVPGITVRSNLLEFIKADHPDFNEESYISKEELQKYRKRYLEQIIQKEASESVKAEKDMIDAITTRELTAEIPGENEQLTHGQRLADKVAEFGGSWTFIISFAVVLALWICFNSFVLLNKGFDPYPYILLNLVLSCIAAIQAPVIMMSQNRQEAKDRLRNEYDYKVNLKAELEIRMLHEKLDHLMIVQMQKIMEFQQLQMDYLEDLSDKLIPPAKESPNSTKPQ